MKLFLRFVEAEAARQAETALFRCYLADGLQALLESVSQTLGGRTLTRRYYDLLQPPSPPPDQTSAGELARALLSRAGIQVI